MAKKSVLRAFHHLLRPLVRVLLRNGVSWDEFAELAKKTFVEVARDDYGIQGRPTNTSRVALITGLSRREVMRVKELLARGDTLDDAQPTNRIAQILTAWHVDADFLTDDGTVVNIEDMKPQSLDSHCSAKPVRFALEMNQGWFAKRGVKPGSKLDGEPFAQR